MNRHRTCGKLDHFMGCECDLNPSHLYINEQNDRIKSLEALVGEMRKHIKHNPDTCVSLVPVLNRFKCNCGRDEIVAKADALLGEKK